VADQLRRGFVYKGVSKQGDMLFCISGRRQNRALITRSFPKFILSGQSAFIGGYQALPGKGNCRETPVKGVPKQGAWGTKKNEKKAAACPLE